VSIYQSLLANLALVILLLGGAIMGLTVVGSKATVERLSGVILRETIGQTESELRHFFDPVMRDLGVLRAWAESGLLDRQDAAARPPPEGGSATVRDDGRGRARS
jgi:hypothetical protein